MLQLNDTNNTKRNELKNRAHILHRSFYSNYYVYKNIEKQRVFSLFSILNSAKVGTERIRESDSSLRCIRKGVE